MTDITTLTENEKRFLNLLEEADKESIWGLAISNVVKNPTVTTVRRLICELKSQANDCGQVMLSILGEPGYNQLMAL